MVRDLAPDRSGAGRARGARARGLAGSPGGTGGRAGPGEKDRLRIASGGGPDRPPRTATFIHGATTASARERVREILELVHGKIEDASAGGRERGRSTLGGCGWGPGRRHRGKLLERRRFGSHRAAG